MQVSLVSNPPFNMAWKQTGLENWDARYMGIGVPPKNNANFVFVLSALKMITKKACFIFPLNILSNSNKDELQIRKMLIENNLIEAVICTPDKMFESVSIPVCVIVINKQKTTQFIELIEISKYKNTTEERE